MSTNECILQFPLFYYEHALRNSQEYEFSSRNSPPKEGGTGGGAYHLLYLTQGEGQVMAGSSAHTVRAGTLLLAAAPRCPFTPDGERDFEAHLLSFDRSILFEEPAHLFERLHEQDKLLYWPPPLSPAVSGIFRQLETLRDLPEGE
ncbi:MAG: AraC family ligand binding domain-containing protein, partial [Eubacteriales bacterium]